jgi:hypothetical protein
MEPSTHKFTGIEIETTVLREAEHPAEAALRFDGYGKSVDVGHVWVLRVEKELKTYADASMTSSLWEYGWLLCNLGKGTLGKGASITRINNVWCQQVMIDDRQLGKIRPLAADGRIRHV